MKTIIIGAGGMLGHALMETFAQHKPLGWDLQEIDITQEQDVMTKIVAQKPELIINAAAYTNVDKAQEEKALAFKVNTQGVKNLAQAARQNDAILVHYSTDYVFGNEKKEGYAEDDKPEHPVNIYGESKLAGEQELLRYTLYPKPYPLKYFLIRSSWLFGPDGKNFVQTIISLAATNPELKIVNDQWGKPTYTKDLAKASKKLIDNNYQFGTYHLVNEPATNWYEFTKKIMAVKNKNQSQIRIIPVSSNEFPRPAKRPHHSILLNTKCPKLRSWQEALKEYIPTLP